MFLINRWITILTNGRHNVQFDTGDMRVPTFYGNVANKGGDDAVYFILMSIVGVVFGGIHCAGWFFSFPSSDEAMLWWVSSTVLTGMAFILPLIFYFAGILLPGFRWLVSTIAVLAIVVYALSRLLLLVEAFISLRHLTLGMLALVKWTSFIPHI